MLFKKYEGNRLQLTVKNMYSWIDELLACSSINFIYSILHLLYDAYFTTDARLKIVFRFDCLH